MTTKKAPRKKRASRKSNPLRTAALERTAYHEAGHVFAAIHLRRPFTKASIKADENSLGRVLCGWWKGFEPGLNTDLRTKQRIEDTVIGLLAGGSAQRIFSGCYDHRGDESDMVSANEIASHLYQGEVLHTFMDFMKAQTDDLLDFPMHWYVTCHLAQGLLHNLELNQQQLRALYNGGLQQYGERQMQTRGGRQK